MSVCLFFCVMRHQLERLSHLDENKKNEVRVGSVMRRHLSVFVASPRLRSATCRLPCMCVQVIPLNRNGYPSLDSVIKIKLNSVDLTQLLSPNSDHAFVERGFCSIVGDLALFLLFESLVGRVDDRKVDFI